MAYTASTKMPTLAEMVYFQWSTPDDPNPKLASPIDDDNTTIQFTSAPLDENGAVVTEAFLFGAEKSNGYVETILVPAGGLSGDGLTATGCTRGIRLSALDWTTGDTDLAVSHGQDSAVFCNVTGVIQAIMVSAVQGTLATGGANFIIGTEPGAGSETITIYRTTTAGVTKGLFRWNLAGTQAEYSNDGTAWIAFDDSIASALVKVSANDTTAGYLNGKLVAGTNITLVEGNDAGDETLTISATSANTTVSEHLIYTPGYLTGDTGAESTFSNWLAVLDGSFRITIDGVAVNVDAIDFTGVTSMADVATYIQTALNTATGGTETVVWSTDHFVITSTDTTSSSAVSVTSTSTGTVGTDISGAGASDWMDCDTGNGTVTAAVLDRTADAGVSVALDSSGDIKSDLLEANLREADTFFGATDISGAEAETLSDGSNADSLHTHAFSESGYNKAGTRYTYEMPFITDSTSSSGYSTLTGEQLSIARIYTTGGATTAQAVTQLQGVSATGTYDFAGSKELIIRMPAFNINPAGANISTLGISDDSVSGAIDFNDNAIWFEISDSGAVTAKSAAAGGSSEDTIITGSVTETDFNVWEIRFDGTTATFYVNTVLLATHTTTVPASGNAYMHLIAPFNATGTGGFGIPFVDIEI